MLSHSPFLSPLIFAICWQPQHSTANSPPSITPHPLNHHHSTNHATHSKLTLPRRQPPASQAPCAQPTSAAEQWCGHSCEHRLLAHRYYAQGTLYQKGMTSSMGSNISAICSLACKDLRMTSFVLEGTRPNHCLKSLTTSVAI